MVYEKRGDLDSAHKYYISAIDIDFNNVDAHFNLAVLFWQQGRWAEVVKEFEIVESLSPGYRDAPRFLAAARQELYKKQPGK